MTWTRRSFYHLDSEHYTICRVNIGARRAYELWRKSPQKCLARRWCTTDEEAAVAVTELKELAK